MNFSLEEIFSMYGRYDKFITLEFEYNSEEYKKFGFRLMGTFLFDLNDRIELDKTLQKDEIPRTDRKIKFAPSELEKLSDEQKIDLDKNGVLASSINTVLASDLPRKNRFRELGKKEIQNVMYIKAPDFSGWDELNRVRFGFLNSRYSKGQDLSPQEFIQYWAFRNHFKIELDKNDYKENFDKTSPEFKEKVRLEVLRIKYQESSISEIEIEEFAKLVVKIILYKNAIINKEIAFATEKINEISNNFGSELGTLKKICRGFDEKVIAFGDKIIFLEFERFVHIYARHVSETQIGERFAGNKSVFQYKFDDIIQVIKMVIHSVNDEIQEHFKQTPDQSFRRMGSRSIYIDGHYYRVEIEPNGMLKDFHPYNDDKNTGANKDV
tara:strand:+ start:1639 stop:2781 length:1143 start_codon:yes stop_codon:yes gene_type:complete